VDGGDRRKRLPISHYYRRMILTAYRRARPRTVEGLEQRVIHGGCGAEARKLAARCQAEAGGAEKMAAAV
jgi:hypothetical protein